MKEMFHVFKNASEEPSLSFPSKLTSTFFNHVNKIIYQTVINKEKQKRSRSIKLICADLLSEMNNNLSVIKKAQGSSLQCYSKFVFYKQLK